MANAGYGFNTSQVTVVLTVAEDAKTMKARFASVPGVGGVLNATNGGFTKVADYLISIAGGARQGGKMLTATSAVAAKGAVTLSSFAAADTVTVNGVVFTGIASGATGNQFNIGASDTLTAVNLAAVFNASASAKTKNVAAATSAAAVVTFTSLVPGEIGNLMTLAISAHGSVSTAVAGGTQDAWGTSRKGL